MIVAIVGAESTGKTTLAAALAARLGAAQVPEMLREWCDAAARTPRIDEQRGIADAQAQRIGAAARGGASVVADTTPLQTAVYSDWVFGDLTLYAEALDWQRRHATFTLLTGLDLPWQPDGLQRDGPHVRGPVDRRLREALDRAGLPYAVIYGSGRARVDAALRAIAGPAAVATRPDAAETGRWQLRCTECLDPACEGRAALSR